MEILSNFDCSPHQGKSNTAFHYCCHTIHEYSNKREISIILGGSDSKHALELLVFLHSNWVIEILDDG